MPSAPAFAASVLAVLLLAACEPARAPDAPPAPLAPPRAVTVAEGLEHPWSLAFLPDGAMLVTERPGRLRRVEADGRIGPPIDGVPRVHAAGQAGLFDVALDPGFAANRRVYLAYAEARGRVNGVAVARGVLADDAQALSDVTVIFRQRPKRAGDFQYGGRLVFDDDGMLFVTLGERLEWRHEAQNPASHLGKVVRITPDGGVPRDNPFVRRRGYAPELWSIGHRNPQGAALHPATRELWTHEHGPHGGDEVNVTRRGRNFGWPRISYGCDYGQPDDCAPVGGRSFAPGLEQPVAWWGPVSIAPSGMTFYTGERFPEWRGDLFIGALGGRALWRLVLDGDEVRTREPLFKELEQRIRDVRQGPDGWIYLLTDDPQGRLIRIER